MGPLDLSLSQSFLFFSRRSYPPSSTQPPLLCLLGKQVTVPASTLAFNEQRQGGEAVGWKVQESVTEKVEKFTESISFDKVLYKQDIMGSKAHATMLAHQGLITDGDRDIILRAALTDLIGDPSKKLHTARSRNDQVATDFRLWCRDAIDTILVKIKHLQTALLHLALNNQALILPGYTHLQRAQPVLLPHVLLTYVEQLERDAGRYVYCRERLNFCPLGACALAGTGLPIDRFMTATALGFTQPMRNSIDAVSDRDFVLEFLYANSNTAIHLSRLGEEWVLWASEEFGFMTPSDSVSTGSSIMPQKKNPDPMELVRGKSARVIGDLVTVLTLCKGLPLAYNRDFQEDKEPMFDSTKTIMGMVDVAAEFAHNVTFNQDRIKKTRSNKGMPFRSSHDVVGKLVGVCVSRGCELQNLSLEEMKKLSPVFEEDVFGFLGVGNSVNKFSSYGSTGSNCVAEQLGYWVNKLKITTT
ncbi:hypothetical protein HID58_052094 [Brassica napus]|uniref:Argininosuccinate lyase n=1 Tax=Brassica napus TaxID=3708 RepID=A0ABQ8AAU5_BRANA|nr:hypothetical protein HID58_052094 [Brassica napus]